MKKCKAGGDCDSCCYLALKGVFKSEGDSMYNIMEPKDVKGLVSKFLPEADGIAGLVRDDGFAKVFDLILMSRMVLRIPGKMHENTEKRLEEYIDAINEYADGRDTYFITNVKIPCCENNAKANGTFYPF